MASLNLLTSPLSPPPPPSPQLGCLPDPDEPERDPHDPSFKLPLWPASIHRDASQEQREGLAALEARATQRATPVISRRTSPQRCVQASSHTAGSAISSPFDTRTARQFRKARPHFSVNHPAAGLTTYARVPGSRQTIEPRPQDDYFEGISNAYPVDSYHWHTRFVNRVASECYKERPVFRNYVDERKELRKERNS